VVSADGSNFIKTMPRLSETHGAVKVVAVRICGPTPARDIAAACLRIAEQFQEDVGKYGVYHYSGLPNLSWADFASVCLPSWQNRTVNAIPTCDYLTPAMHPLNSRKDCKRTSQVFGIS
jgi:dTDP-4-dehydrorhamnose reductase